MEIEALILELQPEDALATCTIARRKISTLRHEPGDNPMERCLPVVHFFTKFTDSRRPLRDRREVVNCPRQIIAKKPENNASDRLFVDGNVEKDFVGDDT